MVASKLRLNPQIPIKLTNDDKPINVWQIAIFQTDYDPYKILVWFSFTSPIAQYDKAMYIQIFFICNFFLC